MTSMTFPIRKECPPGACACEREILLADESADRRILMLTKEEEKTLVARLESMTSLEDLRKMQARLHQLLGVVLTVIPGDNEVRTVLGIHIELEPQRGLCRKTRQSLPAAVRRCLQGNPEIVYAMLDEQGLFGLP